jgi:hypothetical protein
MMGAERDPLVGGYMLHNIVSAAVRSEGGSTGGTPPIPPIPTIPELRVSLAKDHATTLRAYVVALSAMAITYVPSEGAERAYKEVYVEFSKSSYLPIPSLEAPYLKSKVTLLNWTFILHRSLGMTIQGVGPTYSFGDFKRYLAHQMGEVCGECALD